MSDIKYTKTTLDNGMDVILHKDDSIPMVSVNVWYHVGSKDEELGKTGFAHLFEHMMFEGSKHHNENHFEPLQKVGASLNGSTNMDRTNYWENVPSNLIKNLEKNVVVKPGSKSLSLAQDRIKEKNFLMQNKFPITEHLGINSLNEITKVSFGFPWIIKTATLGYDGHGQWYIKNIDDVYNTSSLQSNNTPMVVEKVVEYKCELSVVIAIDDNQN